MSSTQTPTSPSSSSLPKLGPAWYRAAGGNKGGFRPPPAVPLDNNKQQQQQQQQQQRTSSGGNVNSFSALLLEEDDEEPTTTTTTTAPPARAASTTELPRPLFQRNPSSGGGRSLAELAAAAAPTSTMSSSNRTTRISSTATEGSFRKSVDDQPIVRYTREKLLAMRPSCSISLPTLLEPLQGNVILANHALDPVSFDEFDADEIWGAATSSGGRNNPTITSTSSGGGGANAIRTSTSGTLVGTNATNKGSGSSNTVVSSEGGNKGGRWERGVALPPPEEHRTSTSSSSNNKGGLVQAEDDLWDDPIMTTDSANTNNPASDFSSFGMPMADIMMDGGGTHKTNRKQKQDTLLDLSTLSEAALKLDQEIHPSSGTTSSTVIPKSSNLLDHHRKEVNPTRPLASAGTTIRSGSGENVNVFEDFDDDIAAFEDEEPPSSPDELVFVGNKDTATSVIKEETEEVPAVISSSEPEEEEIPITIPEVAAETSASSRLMQMIGMDSSTATTTTIIDSPSPWGLELKPSFNLIPRNPWGEPGGASHEAEWKALQEAELQRQRQVEEQLLEEQKRMARIRLQQQQQEEEERKRAAEVAARKAGAPQQQQQQQQPSQVEMVLIERISTVLENSWGKSDLVTILTALHRDDPRVIPLLPNQDALRALLLRHPNRIQMGRDPAYGVDIAALTLTNAQFVALQQQQEQQQEIQRQQQLLLAQQQQRQQAEAQARAVFQQQQQQQRPTVSTSAPWYYADPQGNIQGPFGGDEMRQWLDGGYFKEDLPISQSPQGPFRALSLYFPDWHVAFVPPAADEKKKLAEEQAAQQQENKERFERERALELDRLEREQRASLQQAQRKEVDHHPSRVDRANEKTRSKESANNVVGDQNASSVQLKMLLGLGGKQQQEEIATLENDRSNSNGGAVRINKKTSPKHYPQPSSADADFSNSVAAATAQPIAAWGGASQQAFVRKKSMSEIQQEEARVAARLSKEREANSLTRTNSGGWANVAAAGTSAWSSTTAPTTTRPAPPVVVGSAGATVPSAAAKPSVPVAASMQQVRAKQQAQVVAAQKQALAQKKRDGSNSASGDEFGAKMSPSLENWCKEQLRKITGSDDLTLVSFCTTLKDDAEIHQYLVAYLGSTPQVNSFASEFISRKNGGKRLVEEWETTGKAKARKGKKTAATGSK